MKPHSITMRSLVMVIAVSIMMLPACKKKETANTSSYTASPSSSPAPTPTPDPNLEKASNVTIEEGTIATVKVNGRRGSSGWRNSRRASSNTATAATTTTTTNTLSDAELSNALNDAYGLSTDTNSGLCGVGTFTPTTGGQLFGSSPVFAGGPYKTDFRVGGSRGAANISDNGQQIRGMATKIYLPDGSEWDLPLLSTPMFAAATPEQYQAYLVAVEPDKSTGKPNPDKVNAYKAANPNSAAYLDYLSVSESRSGFGGNPFYTTHAYVFDIPYGTTQAARVMLNPVSDRFVITDDQFQFNSDNSVDEELTQRIIQQPIMYDMKVLLPRNGDSLTDPSSVWPIDEHRGMVTVGRFAVTSFNDCSTMSFAPDRMPAGIRQPDDPIFAARIKK